MKTLSSPASARDRRPLSTGARFLLFLIFIELIFAVYAVYQIEVRQIDPFKRVLEIEIDIDLGTLSDTYGYSIIVNRFYGVRGGRSLQYCTWNEVEDPTRRNKAEYRECFLNFRSRQFSLAVAGPDEEISGTMTRHFVAQHISVEHISDATVEFWIAPEDQGGHVMQIVATGIQSGPIPPGGSISGVGPDRPARITYLLKCVVETPVAVKTCQ